VEPVPATKNWSSSLVKVEKMGGGGYKGGKGVIRGLELSTPDKIHCPSLVFPNNLHRYSSFEKS
jgi:hypothetical protein